MKPIKTAGTMYENIHEHPIAGVDEAGRGAIAGPVVACACVMPKNLVIEGVYDSKKLTKIKRDELANKIKLCAVCFAYGTIDAKKIDEINIHQATLAAMQNALKGLSVIPKTVLVDGLYPPPSPFPIVCVKGGDSLSHSIACASILAKVYRDGLMEKKHTEYPPYGFNAHKGYGTKKHFEAVFEHGLSPLHRVTFLQKAMDSRINHE